MKILWGHKDGGPDSLVWCWGIEIKNLFSILLLKFEQNSRPAFHTHAFNSFSLLLKGGLHEIMLNKEEKIFKRYSFISTYKNTFHQVKGLAKSNWVLTLRGRWDKEWKELNEHGLQTLTNKRVVLNTQQENLYENH